MPSMANITVKKADGTTDIVYTALTASAGDGIPARWRADTVNAVQSFRPVLELRTQDNGPKTVRRSTASAVYPVVRSVAAVDTLISSGSFETVAQIPKNLTDSEIKEMVYQYANLMASALIKDSVAAGYAPT